VVGTDKDYSQRAVALANEHNDIWATVGQHPVDNGDEVFDYDWYKDLASGPRVVGIGECGLDYFRIEGTLRRQGSGGQAGFKEEKERQEKLFKQQIELALELDLPLMLHVRDKKGSEQAYDDVLKVLKTYTYPESDTINTNQSRAAKPRGNVHFFAGTLATARKFWEIGFTTSFTGVITFADQYDEVIKNAPLTMLHGETDAPYVAPKPFRGQRNEPLHVREVYKRIAEIRDEDPEKVRLQLLENAKKLFDITLTT